MGAVRVCSVTQALLVMAGLTPIRLLREERIKKFEMSAVTNGIKIRAKEANIIMT